MLNLSGMPGIRTVIAFEKNQASGEVKMGPQEQQLEILAQNSTSTLIDILEELEGADDSDALNHIQRPTKRHLLLLI